MNRRLLIGCVLISGVVHAADERKAYKYVDKSGNVTYSQTPPSDGKAANQIDIAPAQRGTGGGTGAYPYYGDTPTYYPYSSGYRPPVTAVQPVPSAQDQRITALKNECERNRGTDCSDPEALRNLESSKIPRRRY